MKKLTYSSMAAARLRANKRQYISLVLGIFLSIFLISTLVLSVYGIYQAELQKRYDKVGYLDMVVFDNPSTTEEIIHSFDEFDRLGHAFISGIVTDKNVYVGYYDEVGFSLMNLNPIEGRLPESAGEIAIEKSALDILEADWQIGDTVELDITPVDGTKEKRSFLLVGYLPERSAYLTISDNNGLNQVPAILTSNQEPAFTVGRLGTHWLMGLAKTATLDQAITSFWEKIHDSDWGAYNDFFGLSISGEQRQYASLGGIIEADREMFVMIAIATALGVSLVLSCCVGIAGAMEGILSKRQEEIGVLRALGATRRQIRRMFGRENLLIALVVSPLSILISIGAVWLLSYALPDSLKFAVNIWLILPIALFSVAVILLSGYLPLVRASKLMPMSVIRDTAMLRRSKGVKSKKEFSATRLIASRQVRFNPTRQFGAALLVGLMLLCSGLLAGTVVSYSDYSLGDEAGFEVWNSGTWYYNGHVGYIHNTSLNKQSISQIRSLPGVKSIGIVRNMTITALLDEVPRYAYIETSNAQFGMLDDEQFEEAMCYPWINADFWCDKWEEKRADYLKFLKDYQIPGEAYQMVITTIDLNSKTLDKLNPYIESGKINVDAINAGTEVIVLAPEFWIKVQAHSYGTMWWNSEEAVKNDRNGEGAVRAAWNDCFYAGEELPLVQLYGTDENGPVSRLDASPKIGAVISDDAGLIYGLLSDAYILTTEQGLENMGLLMEGLWGVNVFLEGDLSIEAEKTLEQQLNAIARRNDGYTVFNRAENYREREAARQQEILLYTAVSILFFSVSVGMIVSSVTRQLNSEGRTIGMLRAVGADEKAILGCYSGRIIASVIGGMGISFALFLIYFLIYLVDAISRGYLASSEIRLMIVITTTIVVLGLLCLMVCKFLLRFRIREIVNKSIIDNIREL
ncbi:MAG: ABC transporter permease [Bacteroidaceae bacterium]|nr:ABC transporter permease [Bacteroidaceae bacterium]